MNLALSAAGQQAALGESVEEALQSATLWETYMVNSAETANMVLLLYLQ